MRRVNRTQWAITVAVMAMANTAFVLLLHYSRFAPPAAGGIRYIPSTAVFLSEAAKLVLSLTCALYVIAQPAGPNLWVSTLLGTLAHQIFLSRDAWKMLLPATCYSAYNILIHIALSNLDAATFTITYQLQLVLFAALSYVLLRRAVNHDRAVALGLLAFGVLLTQWYREGTDTELDEKRTETGPRSVAEFKRMGTALGGPLMAKRSATYEGMDQDLILAYPDMNRNIGAVATIGAAAASAVGGAVFERSSAGDKVQRR
ncbi:hypothetical protein KEM55_004338 [Ascosphaera atra]|nr:hypothetical protein KEM55_004338 [Ascosphaera atra]